MLNKHKSQSTNSNVQKVIVLFSKSEFNINLNLNSLRMAGHSTLRVPRSLLTRIWQNPWGLVCYFQSLFSSCHCPILRESFKPASSAASVPRLAGVSLEKVSALEPRVLPHNSSEAWPPTEGTRQCQILTDVSSTHSQAQVDKTSFYFFLKPLF